MNTHIAQAVENLIHHRRRLAALDVVAKAAGEVSDRAQMDMRQAEIAMRKAQEVLWDAIGEEVNGRS